MNTLHITRGSLQTLQVNMGDLCNQSCSHCHVNASPQGTKRMSEEVCESICAFLARTRVHTLDITGGAPELSPHLPYLVSSARPLAEEVIVRSNLTALLEKGNEALPGFFAEHAVRLICSLPCYTMENVDRQRGKGVFEKSIRALQMLNRAGYGVSGGMALDLVYNPLAGYLPASQKALEADYRRVLRKQYGIEFTSLLTIANVAIGKFRNFLESTGELAQYEQLLEESFNSHTLSGLMCRSSLSVGHDGKVYDCDFNLVLGLALDDASGKPLTIAHLDSGQLHLRNVVTGSHCLACTAGSGSSCQGSLTGKE